MAKNLRVMSHNLPPAASGPVVKGVLAGHWPAVAQASFAIVARWADENGEDDESNVDLAGAYAVKLNSNTGAMFAYPRTNIWDAPLDVDVDDRLVFTWTPPPSPMPRPLYYSLYYQAQANYDPASPAAKLIPNGYADGNIPGHVLTATVDDDSAVTVSTQATLTGIDATAKTLSVQGNLLVSLGAGSVFVVSGTASNNGSKTVISSYLDWTILGVQTVLVVAAVTAESGFTGAVITYAKGPGTFLQTTSPPWGAIESYNLNPCWDDGPGWRPGRISKAYDGRFTRRDNALACPIDEWTVGFTGVSGSRYGQRRLAMWARQSAPLLWLQDNNDTGMFGAWAQYYAYLDSTNCIGNQRLRDGDFWAKFLIQKVVDNGA